MREVKEEQSNIEHDALSVGGATITELRYACDTALFATAPDDLYKYVHAVNQHNATYKLAMNASQKRSCISTNCTKILILV